MRQLLDEALREGRRDAALREWIEFRVKKVAKELLRRVRAVLALDWRKRQSARAGYLGEILQRENRARTARRRLRALSNKSTAKIGRASWTRDQIHER